MIRKPNELHARRKKAIEKHYVSSPAFWDAFSPEIHSSDDSEMEDSGVKSYSSRRLSWRAPDLKLFLQGVDVIHTDTRSNTAYRTASGAPLKERKIGDQPTRRNIPKGLPKLFYGRSWLAMLTEKQRGDLAMSEIQVDYPSRKLVQ